MQIVSTQAEEGMEPPTPMGFVCLFLYLTNSKFQNLKPTFYKLTFFFIAAP